MDALRLLLILSIISSSSAAAAVNSGEKVTFEVYYESLCPYCSNLIVNYLYKLFESDLISITDLKLIPYGNAKIKPNGTITCQVFLFIALFIFVPFFGPFCFSVGIFRLLYFVIALFVLLYNYIEKEAGLLYTWIGSVGIWDENIAGNWVFSFCIALKVCRYFFHVICQTGKAVKGCLLLLVFNVLRKTFRLWTERYY